MVPPGAVDAQDNGLDLRVAAGFFDLPEDVRIEPLDERPVGPDDGDLVNRRPLAIEVLLPRALVHGLGPEDDTAQEQVEEYRAREQKREDASPGTASGRVIRVAHEKVPGRVPIL